MKEIFKDILLKHTTLLGTNLEVCDFDKAAEEINTLYQKKLLNARIDEAKDKPERLKELMEMKKNL